MQVIMVLARPGRKASTDQDYTDPVIQAVDCSETGDLM
jgi:hypothetical protein